MIPALSFLIYAYVVARLIQVPIEFLSRDQGRRTALIAISVLGILAATSAFLDVQEAARHVSSTQP